MTIWKREAPAEFNNTVTMKGKVVSNYIRFATGDWNGLSLSTSNDAAVDAGITMDADTVHQAAWDGGDAGAVTLPAARLGTLAVFRFTAQADGAADIVFSCAGEDTFHLQTLNIPTANNADLTLNERTIGNDWTDTVAIGTIVTLLASENTLTISATATNNLTNIGAELGFFCDAAGKWRLSFRGSQLGSGAINATFTGSAA